MAFSNYHEKFRQVGTDPASYESWVESEPLFSGLDRLKTVMKNIRRRGCNEGSFEHEITVEFAKKDCIKEGNNGTAVVGVTGVCDWCVSSGNLAQRQCFKKKREYNGECKINLLEIKFVAALSNAHRLQVLVYCALYVLEFNSNTNSPKKDHPKRIECCSGMLYNARTGEKEICRMQASDAMAFLLEISHFKYNGKKPKDLRSSIVKDGCGGGSTSTSPKGVRISPATSPQLCSKFMGVAEGNSSTAAASPRLPSAIGSTNGVARSMLSSSVSPRCKLGLGKKRSLGAGSLDPPTRPFPDAKSGDLGRGNYDRKTNPSSVSLSTSPQPSRSVPPLKMTAQARTKDLSSHAMTSLASDATVSDVGCSHSKSLPRHDSKHNNDPLDYPEGRQRHGLMPPLAAQWKPNPNLKGLFNRELPLQQQQQKGDSKRPSGEFGDDFGNDEFGAFDEFATTASQRLLWNSMIESIEKRREGNSEGKVNSDAGNGCTGSGEAVAPAFAPSTEPLAPRSSPKVDDTIVTDPKPQAKKKAASPKKRRQSQVTEVAEDAITISTPMTSTTPAGHAAQGTSSSHAPTVDEDEGPKASSAFALCLKKRAKMNIGQAETKSEYRTQLPAAQTGTSDRPITLDE
jgi:hypothetical protein